MPQSPRSDPAGHYPGFRVARNSSGKRDQWGRRQQESRGHRSGVRGPGVSVPEGPIGRLLRAASEPQNPCLPTGPHGLHHPLSRKLAAHRRKYDAPRPRGAIISAADGIERLDTGASGHRRPPQRSVLTHRSDRSTARITVCQRLQAVRRSSVGRARPLNNHQRLPARRTNPDGWDAEGSCRCLRLARRASTKDGKEPAPAVTTRASSVRPVHTKRKTISSRRAGRRGAGCLLDRGPRGRRPPPLADREGD